MEVVVGFDQTSWVWMNGAVIPWREATTHVSSHALHYGSGVFEGIRCYETDDGPALFRLDAHLERLYASAAVYGLEIPYTQNELTDAVFELVKQNGFSSCYVRPICYYGSGGLGVHPRDCPVEAVILAWPWATYLGTEALDKGVRVTVSPWQKFHSRMMPTTAKATGQYLNSMLAVRDATARGYDEAILLDSTGYIAEGSGENLFLVRSRELITNDERHSILLGITRDAVMTIADDLGLSVIAGDMRIEDLLSADEAFFTGTACEVTPIREVDGTPIGAGRRGPVTEEIQKAFFSITAGRNGRYKEWLQLVSSQVLSTR